MAKKCFDDLGIPELTKSYQTLVDKGMPEFEAGMKVATQWHKDLHKELNTLKTSVGVKTDKYVPFDNSKAVKEINDKYKKLIEEKTTPVDQPLATVPSIENKNAEKPIKEQEDEVSDTTKMPKEPDAGKQKEKPEFHKKVDDIAEALIKALKVKGLTAKLPEGTKKAGSGIADIIHAAADIIKKAHDIAGDIKVAIDEAIKYVRDQFKANDLEDVDEAMLRDYFESTMPPKSQGNGNGSEGTGKPPEEPIATESKDNKGIGERRFTQQELDNPEILPEAKKEIAKNINYVIQTNALSVAEANQILGSIGVDEAYDLVVNNKDLKPAVRVVMGQVLILKYNDLAVKAKDADEKNYYHDKTIAAANYVAEELGTKPGQMIQALSLFQRLSPEAQLRAATKDVKEQAKNKKSKRAEDVNKISEKFKKVNEETVDKIVSSDKVKSKVKKTENTTIKKAKDKIAIAKIRRENIIKKYKGDKGKNLFSTIPGLTSEGIEFVGNLTKTYIDEGIANVEIIAAKILQHLKEVSGKVPNDEVERNVSDIVSKQYAASADKRIAASLKDLEKTVGAIVRKHYTVEEDAKRTLTKKFVEDAGLDQSEAEELAKEIEQEFDGIATRKKNEILNQEKTRFDRIQKGLQGSKKAEPKTLHDSMIRYSNLGAFSNESLMEMIAKKLGLGDLSVEEAAKIVELSNRIKKAPEGSPKNEATEDLLRYRAQLKGTSFGEMAQAVWYANILSGYGTHIKNIVSTFFNGMSFAASEAVRDPKSIPIIIVGGIRGGKRGLVEAWHTVATGRSPIHISKIETPATLERIRFVGGYLNPYNYLKFVGRLMVAEDVLQFQGLKEMRATQLAYREAKKLGHKNPFSKETWKIINEKLLNTKERYSEAEQQVKDEGFSGVEAKRRIYELMEESRPIQMTEDSYGFAASGTFNYEPSGTLGALTTAISSVLDINVGGVKPFRFFVPFTRIITNVANNMLDFSPIGLVRAARGVRGFQTFEGTRVKDAYYVMSAEERKQTIAKASLGIGLTLALYALTKINGDDDEPIIEITGSGTGDYKKDIQLKQSGWQAYSIKVGDNYYSYALTPMAINLAWIGNRNDREKYDKKFDSETELKRMMMSVYQSGQMLSDMTFIGSAAELLKGMASFNPTAMAKSIESTLKNSAKGLIIPNAYSQLAQKIEQINNIPQKEVDGLFQELIQDIPIARNTLNDKINALGDPITRDRDMLISKETTDPTWKFLLDKKGWVSTINKNSLLILDTKTKEERIATQDEYYEFSKMRGGKIKASLAEIMSKGAMTASDGKGGRTVTTQKNIATGRKAASDLTSTELRQLLKAISGKATKETKKKLYRDGSDIDDE